MTATPRAPTPPAWSGIDPGFDRAVFERFIDFDVGAGAPIFWHSVGRVYRQPDGAVVAAVDAVTGNRLVRHEAGRAEALCRTLLVYRDPVTGEVLRDRDGAHIVRKYPYIVANFELRDRTVRIVTEGLSGPHQGGRYGLARVTNEQVFAYDAGGSMFFYWTLFGRVETPRGPVVFTEAYNASTPPAIMVMNRTGTLPPFAGGGDGLVQTTARCFQRFDALPSEVIAFVAAEAPEYCDPPVSWQEIEDCRAQYLGDGAPPTGGKK